MFANKAWQRHGCYRLGSDQYFNFPVQDALVGCMDDWNSLDHFDPTTDSRRLMKHMFDLRKNYRKLLDGYGLNDAGNWTYTIQRPGSNGVETEMGLWAAGRTGVTNQTFGANDTDILLLWMNDNVTTTYNINCNDIKTYLKAPFASGTNIRNLFYPYENITLIDGAESFGSGKRGCFKSIQMDPFGFKAFVPSTNWIAPTPAVTKFEPGHDARVFAEAGDANATTIDIAFEFSAAMDCAGVTKAITLAMSSSGHGSTPTVGSGKCSTVTPNANQSHIVGVDPSAFRWEGTLTNVPDGILTITLTNAPSQNGGSTGVGALICVFSSCHAEVCLSRPRTTSSSGRALQRTR
jgi:alpha-1,3-glucan synthase